MTTFVSHKTRTFGGRTSVPGDKSISIRALIMAALAEGESRISGLPPSEDVETTIRVLKDLGVKISDEGDETVVKGLGLKGFQPPEKPLDFGNSGTASRLMLGVLAGQDFKAVITGDVSLKKRPFRRVIEPLSKMGATFSGKTLPFEIRGAENLKPLKYDLPVASAQVKSAVLLAGLHAKGKSTVVEKTPTRDHSERLLRAFGVRVKKKGRETSLSGPAPLQPADLMIPGDISAAAFPMVATLIAGTAETVIEGVGVNPTRNALAGVLKKMGARITLENRKTDSGEPTADIHIRGGLFKGIATKPDEAAGLIDEFPALFIAAAFAKTPSRFEGLAELRNKESDRLKLMSEGLAANGVRVKEGNDSLEIYPGKVKGGAAIDACHDHRIAMAFLVMGLASEKPVTVLGAQTISTSFPGFARVMNGLGAKIEERT